MIDEQVEVDADVDVFEQSDAAKVSEHTQRWATLPSSALLSLEDADQFLCWRDAVIIAIVGERNGGKTTLITEIYGSFLRGSFADVSFCHSLSLLGFERKIFQSRAESGALQPDTPRTSAQDGLRFFHLAVSNSSNFHRQDLLISERAGEVYREIRDKPDRAAEMIEARKATVIAFIIDGERVAAPRKRAEVFASVRHMVRAFTGVGNIAAQARIQLVATKCDLLEGESMADARNALLEFERSIASMLAGIFDVEMFLTTARDPTSGTKPASGLAPLLRSWLKPLPPVVINNQKMPELSDEFDRLILKRVEQ